MKISDRIIGYTRGDIAQVLNFFENIDVARRAEFEEYVRLVFAYSSKARMDPSIVISQGALETNYFTSYWWNARLNPAGLGITGDPVQSMASWTFTPDTAARAHMSHLMLYATGKIDYPFYVTDDPRAQAYLGAYGNVSKAPTIAGLSSSWAADPRYAEHLIRFGNEIFGATDQVEQTGPSIMYCGRYKDLTTT